MTDWLLKLFLRDIIFSLTFILSLVVALEALFIQIHSFLCLYPYIDEVCGIWL